MTANERRAEIMRILNSRRRETTARLARELGVTDRTIRTDIATLMADNPLETVRGNGGCVKVADWYHPHRNTFSREQESVIITMLDRADEPNQQKVLREMLTAFGSPATRKLYSKEA